MRVAILVPALIALAVIWGGVAIVFRATDSYIMTPEKVVLLVKEAPWKDHRKASKDERKAFLEKITAAVNKLDFEQQRLLREDGRNEIEDFALDLTDEERRWFISQTVEKQFVFVMKRFQSMGLEERKRTLDQTRAEMRKNNRDVDALDGLVTENERAFETIIERGLEEYYNKGSDKRKMQMAPLLSELQRRMQGGRRR